MVLVERRVAVRMVAAPVGAAALRARQRAGRDETRERVLVRAQPLQALAIALEPGELPHRRPRLRCGRRGRVVLERLAGRRCGAAAGVRLVQGGEGGAPAEDEALG